MPALFRAPRQHRATGAVAIALFTATALVPAAALAQSLLVDKGAGVANASIAGQVMDFDPDAAHPKVRTYAASTDNFLTTTGSSVAIAIEPGDGGVRGGAGSKAFTTYAVDGPAAGNGIVTLYVTATAISQILNENSGLIDLSARAQANMQTSDQQTLQIGPGSALLAGQVTQSWHRQGMQDSWGYLLNWSTDWAYSTDSTDHDPANARFQISQGTLQRPSLPTSNTSLTTPIFQTVNVAPNAVLNVAVQVQARAVIIDGFMARQGQVDRLDWPGISADTVAVVNVVPTGVGATPGTAIPGQGAGSWSPALKEYLRGALPWLGGSVGSAIAPYLETAAPPPAPGAAADTVFAYTHLPNGSWFELPAMPSPERTVMAAGGVLILAIEGFAGLDVPLHLLAEGQDLGAFDNGGQIDFVSVLGHGVAAFTLLHPGDPSGVFGGPIALKLRFDADTPLFIATSGPVPVPEPGTAMLCIGGLMLLWTLRARRSSHVARREQIRRP